MDMISRADHNAAVAAARTDAIAGERARIAAIVNSKEAKGKQTAALGIALSADISAAAAAGVLASVPAEPSPQLSIAGRSKDAPGGLVTDALIQVGGPSTSTTGPASDFERGRLIAKSLRPANA